MSETWTEYAVKVGPHIVAQYRIRESAKEHIADLDLMKISSTLVGRNVTASDWLPVDTDGAK